MLMREFMCPLSNSTLPPTPSGSNGPDASPAALAQVRTQAWVEQVVIGLNLCPFAKPVWMKGLIKYVVCTEHEHARIVEHLDRELLTLASSDDRDIQTTLFIMPALEGDYYEFHFLVQSLRRRLKALGLTGTLQMADFHPQYLFADLPGDDIGHATNRAPYPTLHLLREDSVEQARLGSVSAQSITERNLKTLTALGSSGFEALLQSINLK